MVKITEDGLVLTLDSDDDEIVAEPEEEEEDADEAPEGDKEDSAEQPATKKKKTKKQQQKLADEKKKKKQAGEMDPSFAFDDGGLGGSGVAKTSWDFRDALVKLGLKMAPASGANDQEEEGEEEEGKDDGMDEDAIREVTTDEAIVKAAKRRQKLEAKEAKAKALAGEPEQGNNDTDLDPKAKDFFQELGDDLRIKATPGRAILFNQLNLSRPLLRAVEALGYVTPTSIQTAVIPVVLAGKDVCASAVTGSGKTAAFCLPILERLLFRPKKMAATRVLIVSPTRELAVQTHLMLTTLSQFTDMESVLVVGGSRNLRAQEAELRARPDIIVCTPGRMLDHLLNSHSVVLDDLEILVMDEVDQLVDLGFAAEVESLVKECPRQRQTLLFSATMTAKVDHLAQLALNKPVRIRVDNSYEVAPRLEQEFVRVRGANEEHRHAILLALVARTFKKRTLIFCNTKVDAHRTRLVFELSGIKATELHGNLNQAERLESLQLFKEGGADVIVCTDLAARGLDISGIQTVINAEMPRTRATYVHRVGRTARAGCGGRAISLVPDAMRLMMKEIVTDVEDKSSVKSRVIPPPVLAHYEAKVSELQGAIETRLKEEDAEKLAKKAEMEAERATNMLAHREEIMQRPARQWFQSETEKQNVRATAGDAIKNITANGYQKLSASTPSTTQVKPGQLSKKEKRAIEEAARNKKPHRLNRQKRRRLELMQAEDEERKEAAAAAAAEAGEDDGSPKKKKSKKDKGLMTSQKSAAREAKRAAAPTRVRGEGKVGAGVAAARKAGGAGSSKVRPSGSAGTYQLSGFDEDLGTLYQKKQVGGSGGGGGGEGEGGRTSAYKFKGPREGAGEGGVGSGLRKGGKPSHHAFKSKSKHKRR